MNFQKHPRMFLQHLKSLCLALEKSGSIWNYFGALVKLIRLSGRFVYGLQTALHFADGNQSEIARVIIV